MKETSNKNDRPLRCLLFGTGHAFWNYLNLVKSMETSGKIKICAITSKESSYGQIAGYKVIEKNDTNKSKIPSDFIAKFYLGSIFSIGIEILENTKKYTKW